MENAGIEVITTAGTEDVTEVNDRQYLSLFDDSRLYNIEQDGAPVVMCMGESGNVEKDVSVSCRRSS